MKGEEPRRALLRFTICFSKESYVSLEFTKSYVSLQCTKSYASLLYKEVCPSQLCTGRFQKGQFVDGNRVFINPSIEEKTMERALLWLKCAAMHDPVRPVLKQAAAIGWEAKHRQVDLVIERAFKGEELLLRMKGWVTADVAGIAHLIKQHGMLKVLDETDLVVETKDKEAMETLSEELSGAFGQEVWLEPVERPRLE